MSRCDRVVVRCTAKHLMRREVDGRPQVPPRRPDPNLRLVDRQGPAVLPLRRREQVLAPTPPSPDRLVTPAHQGQSSRPPQGQPALVDEDRQGPRPIARTSPPENPSTPEQFRNAVDQVPSLLVCIHTPKGGGTSNPFLKLTVTCATRVTFLSHPGVSHLPPCSVRSAAPSCSRMMGNCTVVRVATPVPTRRRI